MGGGGNEVGQIHLHTCDHPSAILVYSNPCCLALEDVIPTERESEERSSDLSPSSHVK